MPPVNLDGDMTMFTNVVDLDAAALVIGLRLARRLSCATKPTAGAGTRADWNTKE